MPLSTTYETASGPNTPDGEVLGRNANSKVGIYGNVPIARPTVPATGATIQQLVDALAAVGIILKV